MANWIASFIMLVLIPALVFPLIAARGGSPNLTVSGTALPGAALTVLGQNFAPESRISLLWDGGAVPSGSVKINSAGSFRDRLTIPRTAAPGPHTLSAASILKGARRAGAHLTAVTVMVGVIPLSVPAPATPTAAPPSATAPAAPATATPIPTLGPTPLPTPVPPLPTPVAPPPTAAPTPPATATPPPPPPSNIGSPSGQAMPTANLPGWTMLFSDDFRTNVPLGSFPNAVSAKWDAYPYPWSTLGGFYHPQKVVSLHDGVMDLWLHNEGGQWLMAAPMPRINGAGGSLSQLYGRYAVRFRADPLPGYYLAWLLWPSSETWPRDGEIDFPEGHLTGHISAFMHRQGGTSGGDQDAYSTSVPFSGWHTAIIEWSPSNVRFILDGVTVGNSTSRIPSTPMRWVIQTTTSPTGLPPAGTSGNVEIDWVAVWRYTP